MSGLTNRLRVNLLAFVLFIIFIFSIALLTYANGILFSDRYDVQVALPEAGGALPGQEVTVLGKTVGVISDMQFTSDGVLATMSIDGDQQIPDNSRVQVLRRSPLGEQAIDFQPAGPGWTPVAVGATVTTTEQIVPARVPFLLDESAELFRAINNDDVAILVRELAITLRGRTDTIKQINRDALDLNTTLLSGIPDFERLLDTSEPVLRLLDEQGDELRSFFSNTADLMDVLADERVNLGNLLDNASGPLLQVEGLIRNQRANLQCVAHDLIDLNDMLNGPTTATGVDPSQNYRTKLDELERMLQLNTRFTRAFDIGNQYDQTTGATWTRIQLKVEEAGGQDYAVDRATPATKPGAACVTDQWGTGVNAVRQASFQPPIVGGSMDFAPLVDGAGPKPVTPPSTAPAPLRPRPLPATGGGAALLGLGAIATGLLSIRRRR